MQNGLNPSRVWPFRFASARIPDILEAGRQLAAEGVPHGGKRPRVCRVWGPDIFATKRPLSVVACRSLAKTFQSLLDARHYRVLGNVWKVPEVPFCEQYRSLLLARLHEHLRVAIYDLIGAGRFKRNRTAGA